MIVATDSSAILSIGDQGYGVLSYRDWQAGTVHHRRRQSLSRYSGQTGRVH